MDKQLACATFATLLPVLLVAGYLTSETVRFSASSLFATVIFVGAVATYLGGEITAVVGITAKQVTPMEVDFPEFCVILATVSFLGFAATEVIDQAVANRAARRAVGAEPTDGTSV